MQYLKNNTANRVLLKKGDKPVMKIDSEQIVFNSLDNDRHTISFDMDNSNGYIVEMPYDKYCLYSHGKLEKHIHYSINYNSSTTKYFDKTGKPRELRNLIGDIFGL